MRIDAFSSWEFAVADGRKVQCSVFGEEVRWYIASRNLRQPKSVYEKLWCKITHSCCLFAYTRICIDRIDMKRQVNKTCPAWNCHHCRVHKIYRTTTIKINQHLLSNNVCLSSHCACCLSVTIQRKWILCVCVPNVCMKRLRRLTNGSTKIFANLCFTVSGPHSRDSTSFQHTNNKVWFTQREISNKQTHLANETRLLRCVNFESAWKISALTTSFTQCSWGKMMK